MSYKLYAVCNEELPKEYIFSKILNGMKSVFNKPIKRKPKKNKKNKKQSKSSSTNSAKTSTAAVKTVPVKVKSMKNESDVEETNRNSVFKVDVEETVIKSEFKTEVLDVEYQDPPSDLDCDVKYDAQSEDSQNNGEDVKIFKYGNSYYVSRELQKIIPAADIITPKKELQENESFVIHKSYKQQHAPKKKSRRKKRIKDEEESCESESEQNRPKQRKNLNRSRHPKGSSFPKWDIPDRETDELTRDSLNAETIVDHIDTKRNNYILSTHSQDEDDASQSEIPVFEKVFFEEYQKDSSDEDYVPSEGEKISPRKFKKKRASSSDMEDSLPIIQLSKNLEKNKKNKSPVRIPRKRSKIDSSGLMEINKNEVGSNSEEEEEADTSNELEVSNVDPSSRLCGHPYNIYLDPSSVTSYSNFMRTY